MEKLLFTSLPPAQSRWKSFATSWTVQTIVLVSLLALSALDRALPVSHSYQITNLVSYEPPVSHEPQPINTAFAAIAKPNVDASELVTHDIAPLVVKTTSTPQPKPVQDDTIPPELKVETKVPVLPNAPESKIVAVNTFSTGSSMRPTTPKPASAVQTGGFGDPNGVPASLHQSGSVNIGQKGSFELPRGSGYGNGTGGSAPGVVVSAGFGNGVAAATPKKGGGMVRQSGFEVHPSTPEPHQIATDVRPTVPVEITFKPQPDYTDEGRQRRINGEVRLEVLFSSSGQVRVLKVLQGLGFGLDEQAVKAAERIKFKPALHAGQPVDTTAVVHIIFELVS